jgi:hypothetical protein
MASKHYFNSSRKYLTYFLKLKSVKEMYFITKSSNLHYVSPHFCGETYCFCPVHLSVCPSVTQFVSTTPLKLQNRISWNLVGSKDTICSCAYYQEILIAWILWELCPFELKNFPKYTSEAACQRNSSQTTEQNFMKLGR